VKQFDVHPNPSAVSLGSFPYVVVLQSHLLAASHGTVVAPMLRQDGRSGFTRISVQVRFQGEDYLVLVGELAVIDTRLVQRPVGDLHAHEDDIRRALDRLFTGF
jgi:toxin CcdB